MVISPDINRSCFKFCFHDSEIEVHVVNDKIGIPTYTYDRTCLLVDMCETDKYGYYHATNAELPEWGDEMSVFNIMN